MKFTKEQIEFIKDKSKEIEGRIIEGDFLKKPKGMEKDSISDMMMTLAGLLFVSEYSQELIKSLEVEGE